MATDVSAPFPDLDLEEQSIIEVDLGDVGAAITGVVVHFTQNVPDVPAKIELLPPLYAHEAPGLSPGA
jgi:hypothetical protein